MASMRDKFVNLLERQIGYAENPLGSNKQKYSRWFDVEAWQYFNTKKNPSEWCSQLQIWAVAQAEILGKEESKKFLGLPAPKYNEAAGCKQFCEYLTKKGYQLSDKTKGIKGDIIFFNTKKAKCGHVGSIRKEDDKYYYTIEGNKSNKVGEGKYLKTSTTIYCVCHLPWEKYDTEEVKPEPMPIPEPVKPQPVVYPKYKVKTVTGEWLALRVAPNTKSVLIVRMDYGAKVDLVRTVAGEKIYGSNEWAYVNYTKNGRTYTGYCIKSRLKKI